MISRSPTRSTRRQWLAAAAKVSLAAQSSSIQSLAKEAPEAPSSDPPLLTTRPSVVGKGVDLHIERSLWSVIRVPLVGPQACQFRLLWKDDAGTPLRSLGRAAEYLQKQLPAEADLRCLMNAGIFHTDARPLGLHVDEGREEQPLNQAKGKGNFFLEPNGVFFVEAKGQKAGVLSTAAYAQRVAKGWRPKLATQSGPLLVDRGNIHPAFNPTSAHINIRNGVGVTQDGTEAVLAISRLPVTLHQMATVFRDVLQCPNALYLDGSISQAHMPGTRSVSVGGDFVGCLAVWR